VCVCVWSARTSLASSYWCRYCSALRTV